MDGQNLNPNNGANGNGVPAGGQQQNGGQKPPETKKPWIGARIWNGLKARKKDIFKVGGGMILGGALTYAGSELGNRWAANKAAKQQAQYQMQESEVNSLDPNVM